METLVVRPMIALFERTTSQAANSSKINLEFSENVRLGMPNKNVNLLLRTETQNLKNNYFLDDRGQLKYRVITGKILDSAV